MLASTEFKVSNLEIPARELPNDRGHTATRRMKSNEFYGQVSIEEQVGSRQPIDAFESQVRWNPFSWITITELSRRSLGDL